MADRVPFLPSETDRARWAAAGFDVTGADLRFTALLADLTGDPSDYLLTEAWAQTEERAARDAGLGDDPEFWRIFAATKHIQPSMTVVDG
ncbi:MULTISPECIES: hypothetical protein [Mameliella]|uniref:hypothetical protein n=1 Tax=Mameliella TaxID=1434019 RepID=UPI000B52BF85|nr:MULTISPECIES: hypothetical protein [Mameliella]MCR9273224.1 hypothetical protein [Paracoccaceae bacterium]OWV58316.1 hypothetical protein CDZ98_14955 [Mameliella alba]